MDLKVLIEALCKSTRKAGNGICKLKNTDIGNKYSILTADRVFIDAESEKFVKSCYHYEIFADNQGLHLSGVLKQNGVVRAEVVYMPVWEETCIEIEFDDGEVLAISRGLFWSKKEGRKQ